MHFAAQDHILKHAATKILRKQHIAIKNSQHLQDTTKSIYNYKKDFELSFYRQ